MTTMLRLLLPLAFGRSCAVGYRKLLAIAAEVGTLFRLTLLSATVRPCDTWAVADFSLFCSRPSEICWVRKNPSTAMTSADSANVVVTTRNCRDRRQRNRKLSARSRCHLRAALSGRLACRGSRRATIRTGRDCRTILYQPRRFFFFVLLLPFVPFLLFLRVGMRERRAAPPAP